MWNLYDTLLKDLPESPPVESVEISDFWSLAHLAGGQTGMAMTTAGSTIAPSLPGFSGVPAREAADAVKSWNLPEASGAMAVINACCNTPSRMEQLGCAEPYDHYCTWGLDLTGKTVGIVGHLRMPADALKGTKDVFILERNPQPGDYPDSACEYLLPKCDVAIITGSSLVNKTLPRLLELCERAYTIVTGPTVPMCPALLNCGIDRLAGMVIRDLEGLTAHIHSGEDGPPYPYGNTFLLRGDAM